MMFGFMADEPASIAGFTRKRREAVGMPVCVIEEWPAEALIGKFNIKDEHPGIHAEIFSMVNRVLTAGHLPRHSLKIFEKYLKFYDSLTTTLT